MKQHIELPNNPYDLFRVAVEDTKTALLAGAQLNTGDWYINRKAAEPEFTDVCQVCLAGAIMLKHLPNKILLNPEDFDNRTSVLLQTVDDIRRGIFLTRSSTFTNDFFQWKEYVKLSYQSYITQDKRELGMFLQAMDKRVEFLKQFQHIKILIKNE